MIRFPNRHSMQSPGSKFCFICVVSLFVCILAFSVSAYTRQASRYEEQVPPYSSLSVLVGAPASTEQIPSEAISRRNTPLPKRHTLSLFSGGGVLRSITTSTTPAASPSLETVAKGPPPNASENKHGRFHWHKRSPISKQNDNENAYDQFNIQPKPSQNPPSTLQTSSTATKTTSPTNHKPLEPPFPTTSTSTNTNIHTAEPTKRSPSHTYPDTSSHVSGGRADDNPISKPALTILTLGSMTLLGLLLYLGWMVVWRNFGLDLLWEEVRMLSADC